MNKTEAIKLVDSTFFRLERCCESTHNWDRYLALIEQEEKGHRRFCPEGVRCGLTKAQSVRLFAVKEVFDRWVPNDSGSIFTPEAKDYFSIRGSVFAACAIQHERQAEIRNEFTDLEMVTFLRDVDYAEMNKDPRQAVAA